MIVTAARAPAANVHGARRIDAVLRAAVEAKEVPGVVAMAATDKDVLYQGAFGTRALGTGAAMTPDTLFRIASMTKPVTCVAALRPVRARHLSDAGRRMSQGERL